FFFFQAEDGIRDFHVTGVQTCALPIWECSDGLQLFRDDELQKLVLSSKRQNSHLVGFGFEEAGYLLAQACQVGWFGRPSLLGQRSEERRVGKEWCGRGGW